MNARIVIQRKVSTIALVATLGVLLLPSGTSDGGVANINNVHCGQNNQGSVMARSSGAPFHDLNMINALPDTNARQRCDLVQPATTVSGIAVGSGLLDIPAISQSEGYAMSDGFTKCVRVPLVRQKAFASPVGAESPNLCVTGGGTAWSGEMAILGHVWASTPDSSWTVIVIACPQSETRAFCGGTSGGQPTDGMPVTVFTGPLNNAAAIIDPGPDDDTYLAASLGSYTLHDPGADDSVEIGGVKIQLATGDEMTLLDFGIRIRYETSPSGGNQWVVFTTDDSQTVLVRHDTDGDDWLVDKLIIT